MHDIKFIQSIVLAFCLLLPRIILSAEVVKLDSAQTFQRMTRTCNAAGIIAAGCLDSVWYIADSIDADTLLHRGEFACFGRINVTTLYKPSETSRPLVVRSVCSIMDSLWRKEDDVRFYGENKKRSIALSSGAPHSLARDKGAPALFFIQSQTSRVLAVYSVDDTAVVSKIVRTK